MKHILLKYAEGTWYYLTSPYYVVVQKKAPCMGAQMQQPKEDFCLATVLVPLIAIYIGVALPALTTGKSNRPFLALQYALSAYYAQRVYRIPSGDMKSDEKGLWYAMSVILVATATLQHHVWGIACTTNDPKTYKQWTALSVVYYTCLLETFESIRGKKWDLIKHQFSPNATIWDLQKASSCEELFDATSSSPSTSPPP